MRLLGIDYGNKKIGLGFADSDVGLCSLDVIANNEGTITFLAKKLSLSRSIRSLFVPLATGGPHGPEQLEKTRAFIRELAGVVSIPVVEEDESFTTAESIRLQKEEGAQAEEDALAAMLILQAYLEVHL